MNVFSKSKIHFLNFYFIYFLIQAKNSLIYTKHVFYVLSFIALISGADFDAVNNVVF